MAAKSELLKRKIKSGEYRPMNNTTTTFMKKSDMLKQALRDGTYRTDFGVDDSFIQSFVDESQSYFDELNAYQENKTYQGMKDRYSLSDTAGGNLAQEADKILTYANTNRDLLGSENASKLIQLAQNVKLAISTDKQLRRSDYELISKFKTEQDYNDAMISSEYVESDFEEIKVAWDSETNPSKKDAILKAMLFKPDKYANPEYYDKVKTFAQEADKNTLETMKGFLDGEDVVSFAAGQGKRLKDERILRGFGSIQSLGEYSELVTEGKRKYPVEVGEYDSFTDLGKKYNDAWEQSATEDFSNSNHIGFFMELLKRLPEDKREDLLNGKVNIYDLDKNLEPNSLPHFDSFVNDMVDNGRLVRVNHSDGDGFDTIDIFAGEMTDTEIDIYNAHFALGGADRADKYLAYKANSFNQRKAKRDYEQMKDSTIKKVFFGFKAGLDSWENGFLEALGGYDSEYVVTSEDQYQAGMVKESLGDGFTGALFDMNVSIGNMVPSVITSMAANVVLPGSGQLIGAGMTGLSSGGNAYQEARQLGFSEGEARDYAVLSGGMEAGMQYLLGGVSKLGGKLTAGTVNKLASKVNSGIARFALKMGGSMASEGLEEYLQEVLGNAVKNWTLGTDLELEWLSGDAFYAAMLGAFTAGFMEGPGAAIDVFYDAEAKKKQRNATDALFKQALSYPKDSAVYKYAKKLSNSRYELSELEINKLTQAVMTESQNLGKGVYNSVVDALTKAGETGDVDAIAKAVVSVMQGAPLNEAEQTLVANSKLANLTAKVDKWNGKVTFKENKKASKQQYKPLQLPSDILKEKLRAEKATKAEAEAEAQAETKAVSGDKGVALEIGDEQRNSVDIDTENGYNNERGDIDVSGRYDDRRGVKRSAIKNVETTETENSGRSGTGKSVRRESKESFTRRTQENATEVGGRTRKNVNKGNSVYSFVESEPDESNGGKAAKILKTLGVKVVFCEGAIEINNGERTIILTTAFTTSDGSVYISSDSTSSDLAIVFHEIVHVKEKQNSPEYFEFESIVSDNLDMNSDSYKEWATTIYTLHILGDLSEEEINSRWGDKTELDKHIEEAVLSIDNGFYEFFLKETIAYVNQLVSIDIDTATKKFSGMFHNWDAVVQASKKFNKDIGADFSESAFSASENQSNDSDVEQDSTIESDKYAKDESFWTAENENQKEVSLSKKLKDKIASFFGIETDTKKPLSIGEIVSIIKKEFNIPISTGRFRHQAYGIYKNKSRAIRTKISNALPTIAHELGHHLDKLYNLHLLLSINEAMDVLKTDRPDFFNSYKPASRPKEAVAEFMRIYLADRTLAEIKYPKFFKEFERTLNKEDLSKIHAIGDIVNEYYTASKVEVAKASILTRTEARRIDRRGIRLSKIWETLVTWIVDKASPIKKVSKSAYDLFTYSLKSSVRAKNSISGYYLSGLDGKPINLKDDKYKNITDENGDVLAFKYLLKDLQSDAEVNDFRWYLICKHAVEWLDNDKRVFADDTINDKAFLQNQISDLERDNPNFKTIAENVYLWQNVFMQEFAVKSGLVTADAMERLRQKYPCYIPFYRHVNKQNQGVKSGVANQKSLVMYAKGSGLDLYDPFENIIVQVDRWIKAADRNAVMQEIANTVDSEEGLGYLLEKVDIKKIPQKVSSELARNDFSKALEELLNKTGALKKDTDAAVTAILDVFDESVGDSITEFKIAEFQGEAYVAVMRNGAMSVYQVHDQNLLRAVVGMNDANIKGLLKIIGSMTRMMKALTTGVNAVWALTSNSIRDIQSAFVYSSENNPGSFTLDYIKAVGMVLKENFTKGSTETMKLYKTAGGGFNNSLSSDLKTIRATLSDVVSKPGFKERLKAWLNILNRIEALSDAIETAPRLAEFKRVYERTGDYQKALVAAEEITVNFNRSGTQSKVADQIIPYFNASIQGLNKLGTTLTSENGNRRAFIAKIVSTAVITTLLQTAFKYIIDDDGEDEYEKLSEYKKNNFYNFYIGGGNFISIPKPKELGMMASLFERVVEVSTKEDADLKQEIQEFSSYVFDMTIPPLLDEAIIFGTAYEIGANEDFKGSPIVPSYYEGLMPEDQYNQKTSYLARLFGQWFNYSPMKIDYIINSNFGVIGTLNQAFFSPDGDFTGGIKNKFVTDSAYSTDIFNHFYENAEEAARYAASNPEDGNAIYKNKQYTSVKSIVSALNQYGKDLDLEREYKIYARDYVDNFEKHREVDERLVGLLERTGDRDVLYDKTFSTTYSIDGEKHTMSVEDYLGYIEDYYTEIEKEYDEVLKFGYSDERTVAMLKQAKSLVEKKLKRKYKTGE